MEDLSLLETPLGTFFVSLLIGYVLMLIIKPEGKPKSPLGLGRLWLAYSVLVSCLGFLSKFILEPTEDNFLIFLVVVVSWGLILFIVGTICGKFYFNEIRVLQRKKADLIKEKRREDLLSEIAKLESELGVEKEPLKDSDNSDSDRTSTSPNQQIYELFSARKAQEKIHISYKIAVLAVGYIAIMVVAINFFPIYKNELGKELAENNESLSHIKGLNYHDARMKIIDLGWVPDQTLSEGTDEFEVNAKGYGNGERFWKKGYYELEACSGTGEAYCRFLFVNEKGQKLHITTVGEEHASENLFAKVSGYSVH